MNVHLLLTILVIVLCAGSCVAQSWYTGEEPLRRAVIQKDVLSDCNRNADGDVVNVVSTGIVPGEGMRPSISVELANRHNRTGRKYAVYRVDDSGKSRRAGSVKRPVWGVVWGYRNNQNYHAVLMRAGNDDFYGYQLPELQFTILTVADGDTLVHSHRPSAPRPTTTGCTLSLPRADTKSCWATSANAASAFAATTASLATGRVSTWGAEPVLR